MYFADDIDLLPWEPSVFLETAFAHQALLKDSPGTLTGTGLVMNSAVLADILPAMVGAVTLADGSLTQLLEFTAIADTTHATVSALRGRAAESALPPLMGSAVKVTIITFRPQIAAIGDQLLALVGVASDRTTTPAPASTDLTGFRTATIFGTLAALFRTLAEAAPPTNVTLAKKAFYDSLAQSSRRVISATVDQDHDGTPETKVRARCSGPYPCLMHNTFPQFANLLTTNALQKTTKARRHEALERKNIFIFPSCLRVFVVNFFGPKFKSRATFPVTQIKQKGVLPCSQSSPNSPPPTSSTSPNAASPASWALSGGGNANTPAKEKTNSPKPTNRS